MTRQVVWPRSLLDRRREIVDAQRRLRTEQNRPGGARPQALQSLIEELGALPCGHWDVEQHPAGINDWVCTVCQAVITPDWVPLGDQEHQLRRQQRLRQHRGPIVGQLGA